MTDINTDGFNSDWIDQAIFNIEDIRQCLIDNTSIFDRLNRKDKFSAEERRELNQKIAFAGFGQMRCDELIAMQMAAIALIISSHHLGGQPKGFMLTHHHILTFKRDLIDERLVDYGLIAYLIREHDTFKKSAIFDTDYDSNENMYFRISSGYQPLSLLIPLMSDNALAVKSVYEVNQRLFGYALATKKLLMDFSEFISSEIPLSEKQLVDDPDLYRSLTGGRVLKSVYGIRRDFSAFPEVIKFVNPGDIQSLGSSTLSKWLCEAKTCLSDKYTKAKGMAFEQDQLSQQAIGEAEKAIAYLIQQGALWTAPLLDTMDEEFNYSIAKGMPQNESCQLLLDKLLKESRGVKRYCAVVINQIGWDHFRGHVKTDKQRLLVYQYSKNKAVLEDIVDPAIKRKCLESDLEL